VTPWRRSAKKKARTIMQEAGVPVVPGRRTRSTIREVRKLGGKYGYPIAIKAEGGGGGRG